MSTSSTSTSRRQFIKYGVAGVVGFGVASAIEIPILNNSIQNGNDKIKKQDDQISTLTNQNNQLQNQLNMQLQAQGFLTLNPDEQPLVEAIAEVMIPTDSNGAGAKEAGVIYFIDRMLAGSYGKGGNMYLQGPFVTPQSGALTLTGTVFATQTKTALTYPGGTITPRLQAGTAYQYAFNPRQFWRYGLMYLQNYCNSAYGGKFETLTSDKQTQVLQDLFDNKPAAVTFFTGPTPAEFFNELHDMVTAGYWTDPLYGGNIGMVGWQLLASNGVNMGIGQNHTPIELARASTPTRLPPLSLSQIQRGATM